MIDTNLKGPWLCCRAVAELFKEQGSGRVINVSSMLGEVSLPDRTPYASSKGGLTLMTKTLALEWAPFGDHVNALCPGPFLTEINTPAPERPGRHGRDGGRRSRSAAGATPTNSARPPSSSPPTPPAS